MAKPNRMSVNPGYPLSVCAKDKEPFCKENRQLSPQERDAGRTTSAIPEGVLTGLVSGSVAGRLRLRKGNGHPHCYTVCEW